MAQAARVCDSQSAGGDTVNQERMNGDETVPRQDTEALDEAKRPYRTPRLVVHGKLTEITAAGSSHRNDHSGHGSG